MPNPARDQLRLMYSAPATAAGTVRIFSLDGRQEETLYQGELSPGIDRVLDLSLRRNGGATLPSGIHFVRLDAGGRRMDARVLILR